MWEVIRSFFIVVLLGFFTVVSAQLPPEIKAEGTCDGLTKGSSCWMELANHPECYVWNEYLSEGETATWSGKCAGHLPAGKGTIIWTYSGRDSFKITETGTGHLQKGKFHGQWIERYWDGTVGEGPYEDGKRHGQWVYRYQGGEAEEGLYVDGQKHGQWIEGDSARNKSKGRYVNGEKEGTWLYYYEDEGVCVSETYDKGGTFSSREKTKKERCREAGLIP